VRGLVIINRARQVRFDAQAQPPTVWAESGANFGLIARQAALQGLAGLEWAAGIPGTLGGAVVGNAGAHGGDIAGNLIVAEILQPVDDTKVSARESLSPEQLAFSYRSSLLKRQPGTGILLSALLRLQQSTPQVVQAKIDEFVAYRRRTQPPGASMGSMFKNPPGDFAGRLIEAAGLKGSRQGDAQISPLHANFFINLGSATAADVAGLIQLARQTVAEKFDQQLELEIQLLGEW
jgi:UDP-N-acetylmuramate dehydrogenase